MPDQFSLFDDEPPAIAAREESRIAPAPPRAEWQHLGQRLPALVHLGTSSWAFPGWRDIVYGATASETLLARAGLAAYAKHPLLRAVGIDRTFYGPVGANAFADYAAQVPDTFRFLVKAPAVVTDGFVRAERGKPAGDNPRFLDAALALDTFVGPVREGLGAKCGPLVFQFSPLGRARLARMESLLAAMEQFFERIRREAGPSTLLALEVRDPELLGEALVAMLHRTGVRFCFGVHARMPSIAAQAAFFSHSSPGPFVARWSLHSGYAYEEAKAHYAPFDRLVDEDPATRSALAALVNIAIAQGQPAFVTVNNKAEGSAPLSVARLAERIVEGDGCSG